MANLHQAMPQLVEAVPNFGGAIRQVLLRGFAKRTVEQFSADFSEDTPILVAEYGPDRLLLLILEADDARRLMATMRGTAIASASDWAVDPGWSHIKDFLGPLLGLMGSHLPKKGKPRNVRLIRVFSKLRQGPDARFYCGDFAFEYAGVALPEHRFSLRLAYSLELLRDWFGSSATTE